MINKQNHMAKDFNEINGIIPYLILGIAIGIVAITLQPLYAIAIIGGTILLVVSAMKPEVGILAMVILLSSIVFEDELPIVPIGIGSLHLPDILMLFMFLVLQYKLFTDSSFTVRKSPLNVPLALFFGCAVFAAFTAIYLQGAGSGEALRMLRALSYYLIFYLVGNLIRSKEQIRFLVKGLFVVAMVVSLVMLLQAVIGDSLKLIPGRVERSGTFDQQFQTLRLLPPGQTLLYTLLISAISVISFKKYSSILASGYFYLIMALSVGVVLTYNRTYWVAILLSCSILFFLIPMIAKKRLIALFLTLVLLAGSLRLVSGDNAKFKDTFTAITERFTSLLTGRYLHRSSSVEDRYTENKYAIEQIKKHPVIGIGLANQYRPILFEEDQTAHYVHNGYLWILVDMGIIGFLSFFWFFIGFILRGFKKWKHIEDEYLRSLVLGFMLSGVGIIPMALYNPIYLQWFSIVVLAVVIGLTESIILLNDEAAPKQAN